MSKFECLPAGKDLHLWLLVAVEVASGDILVWVDGEEVGVSFRSLHWPGPIKFANARGQETVIPFMQGAIVPGEWPHDLRRQEYVCNSRALYMPWWGQKRGAAGYLAVLETDADAGCRFDHPAGGPTHVGPRWDDSLGRIGYQRRMRYSFFDRCDYVPLCKSYRAWVRRQGRFVSLAEKIAATPAVQRLIGSPVVHTDIAHNIHPRSRYYDAQNPEKNRQCVEFCTRARQLKSLRDMGVERAYVHLDGWGVQGYDSHHPDYLPPNAEAGGWDGLKRLADTCRGLGYVFALHDEYRDYYHNAPSFDSRNAIHDEAGGVPEKSVWMGVLSQSCAQRWRRPTSCATI